MKITEKQLLMLVQILKDTLHFGGNHFTYDLDQRHDLINMIINQQSNAIKDISE